MVAEHVDSRGMQGAHLHLQSPALKQVVQPNITEGNRTGHLVLKEGVFEIVTSLHIYLVMSKSSRGPVVERASVGVATCVGAGFGL